MGERVSVKRFYETVSVRPTESGRFAIDLDGRRVRTPARRTLEVPTRSLARAIAEEWDAQEGTVDPRRMPLTRTANSALDRVAPERTSVEQHLLAYAANDLLCYRAGAPEALAARQRESWDPLVDWARTTLGMNLILTESVMPVAQPEANELAARNAIAALDAFRLACLYAIVTATGSFVLGLAVLHGRLQGDQAVDLATIDEEWQAEHWGRDDAAEDVVTETRESIAAAERMLVLLDEA